MGTHLTATGLPAGRDWRLLDPQALAGAVGADEHVFVPLASWLAEAAWRDRAPTRTGVWMDGGDDPAELAPDLPSLAAVAVRYASFRDGRGHSLARRLRLRHGFRGRLIAVGDILTDHLLAMARCGYDGFQLRDDQDPGVARRALAAFGSAYQRGYALPALGDPQAGA